MYIYIYRHIDRYIHIHIHTSESGTGFLCFGFWMFGFRLGFNEALDAPSVPKALNSKLQTLKGPFLGP